MRGTRTNQSSQSGDTKDRGSNASRQRGAAATAASAASAVGACVEAAAPAEILALQRAIGNAAVGKLMDVQRHAHGPGCGHGRHGGQGAEDEQAPVQRSSVHSVLAASGKPLDAPLRAEMETRLGTDFSDVRVHDDTAAKRSAAEIGARAYTSGSHVVIGAGGGDKHTLAHELTHVIQQRQGAVAGTDNGSGLKVSDPGDRFEKAAEANASRAMAAPLPAAEPAVQRRPVAAVSAGAPSVQRADVQHVLTEEEWKGRSGAGGSSREAATRDGELRAKAKDRGAAKKWKQGKPRRMEAILGDVGRGLLEDLAKSKSDGQLKLYRAMSREEADGILAYVRENRLAATEAWTGNGGEEGRHYRSAIGAMPIGKHLGDYKQADDYRKEKGDAHAIMLEFTLKPGAHTMIFDPKYAALGPGRKNEYIRAAHEGTHENANRNEGTLAGYIGVKSEEREPYSISLATDRKMGPGPSQLLFQLFVQSVRELGPQTP